MEVEKNWLLLQEWAFKVSCVASGEEPGLTPWAGAVEKVVGSSNDRRVLRSLRLPLGALALDLHSLLGDLPVPR